ncbi:MAG: PorT family protein [Bacteroidetes bacterium]|nr:PorT family protein [Bacteroidota bacterium]
MKYLKSITLLLALFIALNQTNAQTDSSKSKKPVIINGKKIKITIDTKESKENQDNTEIIINEDTLKIGHIPDKKVPEKPKNFEKKHKQHKEEKSVSRVKSHWFNFDWGFNFLEYNKTLDMPENYKDLDLENGKGCEFNVRIFEQEIKVAKSLSFIYGVGVDWNNYRFKNNVDLFRDSAVLKYEINQNINYKKNKLVSTYLTVPVLVKFKFGNSKKKKDVFKIAVGPQFGYLIGSHQKKKWEENGKQKTKVKGDYNLDELRIGYSMYLGSGDINFYFRYFPEPTFKKDKGPDVNTICAGIVFGGF